MDMQTKTRDRKQPDGQDQHQLLVPGRARPCVRVLVGNEAGGRDTAGRGEQGVQCCREEANLDLEDTSSGRTVGLFE